VTGATIENLTIRNAFARTLGAGILCQDSTIITCRNVEITSCRDGGLICVDSAPSITNCYFTNNIAKQGGGISCEAGPLHLGSSVQVFGCIVMGNQAPGGGGVFVSGSASHATFDQCVISSNSIDQDTGNGGGMNFMSANVTVSNCIINNNEAHGTGGGVNVEDSQVTLTDCVIQGNSATTLSAAGGGISIGYNASVSVNGCVIARNTCLGSSAASAGGGVCIFSSAIEANLTGCTVAQNTITSGFGSGIGMFYVSPTIARSLIAFNGPGDALYCGEGAVPAVSCVDMFGNQGGDTFCGSLGTGNFSADPLFCNMAADDYRLQSGSPCLPGHHPGGPAVCNGQLIGGAGQGCIPVGVEDGSGGAPAAFLRGNEPNPFVGNTVIRYELNRSAWASLRIFDVSGRLVRTLIEGRIAAGSQQATWDGRNTKGEPVPSGIYFYSLKTDGSGETRRMVLAR